MIRPGKPNKPVRAGIRALLGSIKLEFSATTPHMPEIIKSRAANNLFLLSFSNNTIKPIRQSKSRCTNGLVVLWITGRANSISGMKRNRIKKVITRATKLASNPFLPSPLITILWPGNTLIAVFISGKERKREGK
jgi:hypothetical protein